MALGARAALSSLVSVFPQIAWLLEYKAAIFSLAARMLARAGLMQWRAGMLPCPAAPTLAGGCRRTRSVVIVYIGFN